LILPEEGIGFSNYESIGLRNKPSFEKASFYLSADKSITVKIILSLTEIAIHTNRV